MKETRTLDRLAIMGIVLSAMLVALFVRFQINMTNTVSDSGSGKGTREAVLERMPDSEIRADFTVLTAWEAQSHTDAYAKRMDTIAEALGRYPNSARLQLRAGTLPDGAPHREPLLKLAELDPENSLPLYLLAAVAAERDAFDEALDLIRRGNRLGRYTTYPLSAEDMPSVGILDAMTMLTTMDIMDPARHSRRLALHIGEHASELHATGSTDEALAILDDVKHMANAVMHAEDGVIMNVLFGSAIMGLVQHHEKMILIDAGYHERLARIEEEEAWLSYVRAGTRQHTYEMIDDMFVTAARFCAPLAILITLSALVFGVLIEGFYYLKLARVSRGTRGSILHLEATRRAFPVHRLLNLYSLLLVPLALVSVILLYPRHSITTVVLLAGFLILASSGITFLLEWYARRSYRQEYRQVANEADSEVPERLWKDAPVHDMREVARRLAGVLGGAATFLVLVGLIISMGMKLTIGAFPWQFEHITIDMQNRERSYTRALLAGEMQISEEWLRAEEERDRKRTEEAQEASSPEVEEEQ